MDNWDNRVAKYAHVHRGASVWGVRSSAQTPRHRGARRDGQYVAANELWFAEQRAVEHAPPLADRRSLAIHPRTRCRSGYMRVEALGGRWITWTSRLRLLGRRAPWARDLGQGRRRALTRARPSAAWHAPAWAGGSGRRSEDDMITLYGFGRIFPEGRGETKDLRAQWALEASCGRIRCRAPTDSFHSGICSPTE